MTFKTISGHENWYGPIKFDRSYHHAVSKTSLIFNIIWENMNNICLSRNCTNYLPWMKKLLIQHVTENKLWVYDLLSFTDKHEKAAICVKLTCLLCTFVVVVIICKTLLWLLLFAKLTVHIASNSLLQQTRIYLSAVTQVHAYVTIPTFSWL